MVEVEDGSLFELLLVPSSTLDMDASELDSCMLEVLWLLYPPPGTRLLGGGCWLR